MIRRERMRRERWWWRWFVSGVLVLVLTAPGVAQGSDADDDDRPARVPPSLASPQATMRTFLEAMNESPPDRDRAITCLDLGSITVDAAPELAVKLYRVLNRIEIVDLETIPSDRERLLLRSGEWTYFPPGRWRTRQMSPIRESTSARFDAVRDRAADISLTLAQSADGAWRFSPSTVASIESLWDRLYMLPVVHGLDETLTLREHIERLWPNQLRVNGFLGVKYWQWLSMMALIVIGLIVELVVRSIVIAASIRVIRRRGGDAKRETLRRTVRPFGFAVTALFWLWAIALLGLPPEALMVIAPAARLFAILAFVWAAWRATDLIGEVLASHAEQTESKFDDLVIPLVRKSVKIVVCVFGLIYIANSLNVEIAPLLTGLGIGGVGFAFAAKDTLENFFGSVTVIVDRPFQVGDWVEIGDTEGTVEELGLRSVRIRTFYNSLVTIPTANLVRAAVDNYGRRKYRRWTTHLNITYDTPPDTIEAFCEGIREIIRLHPYTRTDYFQVWLHKFGAHSLDVLIYLFFETPDWQTELRERHRLMLDVIRLADHLGVAFAFPTQTIELKQLDAELAHDPMEVPERAAEFRALRAGRSAARELTANAGWRDRKPGPYRFSNSGDDSDLSDENPQTADTQIESKIGGDA